MSFNSSFFSGNRQRLKQQAKTDLIVIAGGGIIQSSSWETFPFRQDSNFWYLTGVNEPDFVLVMNGSDEWLIAPKRQKIREIFDGQLDIETIVKMAGIKTVLDERAGWQKLKSALSKKPVGTLLPATYYSRSEGVYANPVRARLVKKLKVAGGKKFEDLRPALAQLRMIKQPAEIAAVQQAVDVTVDSFSEVFERRAEFKYEYELEAALTAAFRTRGAAGFSFSPIVASGKKACTLHYVANNQKLNPKELVLIDGGARVNNYPADLTRTIALQKPTARQQAVFNAVNRVRQLAISQLKPGVLLKDYSQKISQSMAEELVSLKLIKQARPNLARQYFPHGVSHFLGLEVHDVGDYTQPLQAGMILTVEPGIYIPSENMAVRQEDNVLITKDGNQVLSSKLKHKL